MKTQICKTLILFSLFLILGCENNDENSQSETNIEFTEIGKGALYGNGEEGIIQSNLIISSQTDWENLINQINSVNNTTNNFTDIVVDFNGFIIIAIFHEVKASSWEIEINEITESENSIFVSKTERQFTNSVITQPFHIVKIPATEKTIIFE